MGQPARIGQYKIKRRLGSGGFATVYLAQDEDLDRLVAIKVLAENWSADDDIRRRFIDEARILSRLDHERIVRVFATSPRSESRQPYFVMEYADLGTLHDRIRQRSEAGERYSVREAVSISLEIAEGLAVAHDNGIIHRDLKPRNVLFRGVPAHAYLRGGQASPPERLMLADFGLARQLTAAKGYSITAGTVYYMAPEQANAETSGRVNERSDIYSAAVVLYELLAGEVPFPYESMRDIERAHGEGRLRPLRELRSDVPAGLDRVVQKALSLDPENRHASARDWADALRSAVEGVDEVKDPLRDPIDGPIGGGDTVTDPGPDQRQPTGRYSILANRQTPALIIYLLDCSGSMGERLGEKRRVDVVSDALGVAIRRLIRLSSRGGNIFSRYRVAMFAYGDGVTRLLSDDIQTIDKIADTGLPKLRFGGWTNTAAGFARVEQLLRSELPNLVDCPAPLVCHMTDGEYTKDDPELIVRRIMQMEVPDGNVLVENIFISDTILPAPIHDSKRWPGVLPGTELSNQYARKLRALSSPLPESYRATMNREFGYSIEPGAVMMLPGMSPDLVEMGFVMSTATPVAR